MEMTMRHVLMAVLLGSAILLAAPTSAQQSPTQPPEPALQQQVRISEMEGLGVYDFRGAQIGTVDRVIVDPQTGRHFVVLARGGFFGVGEDEVAVPLESFILQGDRLMIEDMAQADLDALRDDQSYIDLPRARADEQVGIGTAN